MRRGKTKKVRKTIVLVLTEGLRELYQTLYEEIDVEAYSQFGYAFPDIPDSNWNWEVAE